MTSFTPSPTFPIRLRPANLQDASLVFAWRNHPSTYRYFFNPKPVTWDEHEAWFTRALSNEKCHFLIAEDALAHPIGVLRFEAMAGSLAAEVSIMVSPGLEGRGIGHRMLECGTDWLLEHTAIRHIEAKVLDANVGSLKVFEKAGFRTAYRVMARTLNPPKDH